jgi:hypothetical protein
MKVYPAVINMSLRCILCIPLGLVIGVLCITVIGAPVGLALGMAVGAWCSAPLRRHPEFNVKGDAE